MDMKIKKYFVAALATCCLFLTGCEDETDPGGTAVEKMAGDWWVTVDIIENGEIIKNPYINYGIEYFEIYTYNTAANKSTEMWIDDYGNFWMFKLKVDVNYDNRTFSTSGFTDNEDLAFKSFITDGKILEGAATTPSGMPADSIVFFIRFDDDGEDGECIHRISGFRRTGFPADDF